jgi:hypothetical protein
MAPCKPHEAVSMPKTNADKGSSCIYCYSGTQRLPDVLSKSRWQLACVARFYATMDGVSFDVAVEFLYESDWDTGTRLLG